MKLLFCCVDVSATTLFILSVVGNLIYCGLTLAEYLPNTHDHSDANHRVYISAMVTIVLAGIIGALGIYAMVIYVAYGSITSQPQQLYFRLSNIALIAIIIARIIAHITGHKLAPWSFGWFVTFLLYSWNHQLKNNATGKSGGALLD